MLILCCSSLLQCAAFCHNTLLFLPHFILSQQSFLCRDRSFFGSLTLCPAKYVVPSIICRDTLMCGYWNIYVATLTIVLRHYLCAASSICVPTQSFMSRQYFCWFLLQQCFLYCLHSRRDQESLSRQSLVVIEPIFLLQLHFYVAT